MERGEEWAGGAELPGTFEAFFGELRAKLAGRAAFERPRLEGTVKWLDGARCAWPERYAGEVVPHLAGWRGDPTDVWALGVEDLELHERVLPPEGGPAYISVLLCMGAGYGARDVARIASSAHLSRLDELVFGGNELTPGALAALTASPFLPGLHELNLEECGVTRDALAQLAKSELFAGLRSLHLGSNELSARGLGELAWAPALEALSLRHLGPGGLDGPLGRLCRGPGFERLVALDLSVNALGVADVERLERSGLLRRLERLELEYCDLGPTEVGWLAGLGGRGAVQLERLLLEGNGGIGDAGALVLAAGPALCGLSELSLSWCGIGDDGARWLADSPHLAGLSRLDLSFNPIGDEGALALSATPALASLERLDLTGNPIGPRGREALEASPFVADAVVGADSFFPDEEWD